MASDDRTLMVPSALRCWFSERATPSVLVELGYMSHAEDEKLMVSEAWQKQVSSAMAQAVDHYFTRHPAGSR